MHYAKKKYSDYSELLFSTFNVAMTVTGMVMLARITPNTASSLSMTRIEIEVLFILIHNKGMLLCFSFHHTHQKPFCILDM